MKKVCLYLCVLVVFLGITGCSSTTNIDLHFFASDVDSIELYHFSVPANAQKKIVTESSDIEAIIDTLTTISVKDDNYVTPAGTTTTSFRFNLSDGSKFEIIYVGHGVKKGAIMSSYVFDYFTMADVGGLWKNFQYEATSIEESELPHYEE